MAELRQDMVTGRWVVVATERAMRPSDFTVPCFVPRGEHDECPFCPGNEELTPPEVFAVRPRGSSPDGPGWRVRVVPNKFPAFGSGEEPVRTADGFPRRKAEGSHEVIIHTPDHHRSMATMDHGEALLVLGVYRRRYLDNRDRRDVRYVHIIVNHGRESGASLEHSHSQLFAMPLVPPLMLEELQGAAGYEAKRGRCVFCEMLEAELAEASRIVGVNDAFVAFTPFASRLPFEVWIVPRPHQGSFDMITENMMDGLTSMLQGVLGMYRDRLSDPPYNYYIHSAPCDGADHESYHWHLEIIPKLTAPGAMELGTSMWINITTPEHAASHLRGNLSDGRVVNRDAGTR